MTVPLQDKDQTRWFSEELLPYEDALRAWLRAKFPSITDVDDLIQVAYIKVLKAYQKAGVEMKAPKAFLFATARNLALDYIKREKIIRFEPIVENESSIVLESESKSKENAKSKEDLELITEAIQTLPERCRQVFTLGKVYGYSHQEIALQLGISVNTVAV
ncbi:MAG: RNA polymerase sigma factor, partial [Verrucomicrobiota bacterium]